MFVSAHYGGVDVVINFKSGEPWKKVFGPVFIYLNTTSDKENAVSVLWENAKEQVKTTSCKFSSIICMNLTNSKLNGLNNMQRTSLLHFL